MSSNLAQTPPMGWNSYDCFGVSVREDEVIRNADYMAQHLRPLGWEYIVIDGEWAEPHPINTVHDQPTSNLNMDDYGRLIPALNRFPSSADDKGFKPLADYLHKKGLKFGIHIMRGIPRQAVTINAPILHTTYCAQDIADTTRTCAWNPDMYGIDVSHEGGQAYYDSLLQLYASWEVDFIKADDMISPYHAVEVEALALAVQRCGRPIVLSLSPGDHLSLEWADHLKRHSHLWRISSDFWDRWDDLHAQFERCRQWISHAGPGHWIDADMLRLSSCIMKESCICI